MNYEAVCRTAPATPGLSITVCNSGFLYFYSLYSPFLTPDPKVTVGRNDAVEGGLSNFLVEAEGMAAKAWLLVHGGNWKEVLEDKRGSQVFGQEELEDKRGSQVFGQEELEDKRGSQEERQVDSPPKMPIKVTDL